MTLVPFRNSMRLFLGRMVARSSGRARGTHVIQRRVKVHGLPPRTGFSKRTEPALRHGFDPGSAGDRFTEGFDTADLTDVKALLEELK